MAYGGTVLSVLVLIATGVSGMGPASQSTCQCSGGFLKDGASIISDRSSGGQKEEFGGSHCKSTRFGVPFCIVGSEGMPTDGFDSCSIESTANSDGEHQYLSFEPCAPKPLPECAMAPSHTRAATNGLGESTTAAGVCQCDAEGLVKNKFQDLHSQPMTKWQQCAKPDPAQADKCSSLFTLGSLEKGDYGETEAVESCSGWRSSKHPDACFLRNRPSAPMDCNAYCALVGVEEGSPDAGLWTCAVAGDTVDDFKCALQDEDVADLQELSCRFRGYDLCACVPPNECSCDNGYGAVGIDCKVHSTKQCAACFDGFALDNVTRVCTATATTITTNAATTQTNAQDTTAPTGGGTTTSAGAGASTGNTTTTAAAATATATATGAGAGAGGAPASITTALPSTTPAAGGARSSTTASPPNRGGGSNGGGVGGVVVGVVLVVVVAVLVVLRKYLPALRKGEYADVAGASSGVGGRAGRAGGEDSIVLTAMGDADDDIVRDSAHIAVANNVRKIKVQSMTVEITETSIA